MIEYKDVPKEYDFCSEFDTWILAFCPESDSWFATNRRFFFYEYPMEFPNEKAAISYFKCNPNVFLNLENNTSIYRPCFTTDGVWLDNTKELVRVELY